VAALALLLLLAPLAQSTRGFEGLVVDDHRRPVARARVVLGELGHATVVYGGALDATYAATPGLEGAERARWAAELAADADGRFRVEGLAPGEYSAVATDRERGIALAVFQVRGEGGPAEVLELRPPAFLEVEITGLERDPSRHVLRLDPVGVGANLSIVPRLEERGRSWSFRSAPLPAVPAWRLLGTERVLEGDYQATLFSETYPLAPGEDRKVALDLARGAGIAGTVVDAEGRPLSGVSVVARSAAESGPERGAVTDASGRYAIRGLEEGACVCEAARWILRETPGCGVGFQDVYARKELAVPLADARAGDFRIDSTLPRPVVGAEAPLFEARAVDGRTIALRDLRGKVVLLDFWATWCPMCRAEMPRLVETYAQRAPDGNFEIVGVSVDEDVGLVPRFAASRGLRWPQLALGPEARNPIARLYNAHSTPMTVLVDAEGRIAAVNLLGEALRAKVAELLAPR